MLVMKKNGQTQTVYLPVQQINMGNTKPTAPITGRQPVIDRRSPDPSSVLRSDRYPIPSFFEYRMRSVDQDIVS